MKFIKGICLLTCLLSMSLSYATVNLIENTIMGFGKIIPKSGECYLQYDEFSKDEIRLSSPDICLASHGQTGKLVLATSPGEDITFKLKVPVAENGALLSAVDFTIEGIVSNDLDVKKSVRADQFVTINSGNSGRVTVIVGGLLDIKASLPFGDNVTLTYKIEY